MDVKTEEHIARDGLGSRDEVRDMDWQEVRTCCSGWKTALTSCPWREGFLMICGSMTMKTTSGK